MAHWQFLTAALLCGACATTQGGDAPQRFAADVLGAYDNSAQMGYAPAGLVEARRLDLEATGDVSVLRATWRERVDAAPVKTATWRFSTDQTGSPSLDIGGACPLRLERTGKGAWDARIDAEECPLGNRRAYQARITLTPTAILFEERMLALDGADPTPTPPLDLRRIP